MIRLIGTGSAFYTMKVNGVPHTTIVDGVPKVVTFAQWWTVSTAAFDYKANNPADVVSILLQQELRVEGTVQTLPVPVPIPVPVPTPIPAPSQNRGPQWLPVPTITFTRGIARNITIDAYASDSDSDALAIVKNAAALPAGVSYNAALKRFEYDGSGPLVSETTSGNVLTADDGKP